MGINMQPQKFVSGRHLALKDVLQDFFPYVWIYSTRPFLSRKNSLCLKVEIPDIVLVSEWIFRELTRATGLCFLFCSHSLHQTCFVLCSCALSWPVTGTDKSVVLGLFFLIFLFRSIKTHDWLCLLTLDSTWGLLWELLKNLSYVFCTQWLLPMSTCKIIKHPIMSWKLSSFPSHHNCFPTDRFSAISGVNDLLWRQKSRNLSSHCVLAVLFLLPNFCYSGGKKNSINIANVSS